MKRQFFIHDGDARNKIAAQAFIGTLPKDGKDYTVTVELDEDTRGVRANKFWFAAIVEPFRQYNLAQGEIYTKEECHAILKRELLPAKTFRSALTGKLMAVPADSHDMKVGEFSALIEKGIVYLAQLGITVSPPGDYLARRTAARRKIARPIAGGEVAGKMK